MLTEQELIQPGRLCCAECEGMLITDPDSGEQICTLCGVVNDTIEVEVRYRHHTRRIGLVRQGSERPAVDWRQLRLSSVITEDDGEMKRSHALEISELKLTGNSEAVEEIELTNNPRPEAEMRQFVQERASKIM